MFFYYSLGQRFAGPLGLSSRSCVDGSYSYHDGGNDVRSPFSLGMAISWSLHMVL